MMRMFGSRVARGTPPPVLNAIKHELARNPGAETVRIQKVYFQPSARRWKVWQGAALVLVAGALITSSGWEIEIIEEPDTAVDRAKQAQRSQASRTGVGSEQQKKPAIFIPYPFSTEVIQPEPYARGDPMLKELGKIYHNEQIQRRIKDDVAKFTVKYLADLLEQYDQKHAAVGPAFGRLQRATTTLYLFYPNRPPPFYAQRGIEISEDGITFGQTKAPVDPHFVSMLDKALWPSPVMKGMWDYTRAAGAQVFRQVLGSDGSKPQPPRPQSNAARSPPDRARGSIYGGGKGLAPRKPHVPGGRRDGEEASNPSSQPQSAEKKGGALPPEGNEASTDPARNKIIDPSKVGTLVAESLSLAPNLDRQAWNKLVDNTKQFVRRQPDFGPPGSVKVNGVVRVWCEYGSVLVDVDCFWDPRAEVVDHQSYRINFRAISSRADPQGLVTK